jgi:hypothetical protein
MITPTLQPEDLLLKTKPTLTQPTVLMLLKVFLQLFFRGMEVLHLDLYF